MCGARQYMGNLCTCQFFFEPTLNNKSIFKKEISHASWWNNTPLPYLAKEIKPESDQATGSICQFAGNKDKRSMQNYLDK